MDNVIVRSSRIGGCFCHHRDLVDFRACGSLDGINFQLGFLIIYSLVPSVCLLEANTSYSLYPIPIFHYPFFTFAQYESVYFIFVFIMAASAIDVRPDRQPEVIIVLL